MRSVGTPPLSRSHATSGTRTRVIAVGRAHEAPAPHDAQPVRPHDPLQTLVVDRYAPPTKLDRHAAIAIAREIVLDVADHLDQRLVIRRPPICLGRTLVQRAARQADYFASPSDRAAGGPLTMHEL